MLGSSIIRISFHSKVNLKYPQLTSRVQVPMLKREKRIVCTPSVTRKGVKSPRGDLDAATASTSVFMQVPVIVVGRNDYETYRDSIDRLKDTGFEVVSKITFEEPALNFRVS